MIKKPYFILPLIIQKLIWVPTRFTLSFFGHLQIKGLDNLKNINTNVIFALNHTSEIDAFILPGSLPFFSQFSPVFYSAAEQKNFKDPKFGWKRFFYGGLIFKAMGAYPIVQGLKDYEKAMKTHISIIKDGGTMGVFPEGGITPDGNIQEARGGVAYLAYKTGVPIVPVRLKGSYSLRPGPYFKMKRRLSITYGSPIYVNSKEVFKLEDFKRISNDVMDTIRILGGDSPVYISRRPYTQPTQEEDRPAYNKARV